MEKLIAALERLYLRADQRCADGAVLTPALLERQWRGEATPAIDLAGADGLVRTLVLDFPTTNGKDGWGALCAVANALQERWQLPAPAVSVSGAEGYSLWLSLARPVPLAQAHDFMRAVLPDGPGARQGSAELPPCLHRASGRWAAFINPGMGASFAGETGLEMAPPFAAQAAFLEDLKSIGEVQFNQVLAARAAAVAAGEDNAGAAAAVAMTGGAPRALACAAGKMPVAGAPAGLLLKDATLEDIVRFLHAHNIEPTFRHLMPNGTT